MAGMVADKQADLEVPYWVADEGTIEVMKSRSRVKCPSWRL